MTSDLPETWAELIIEIPHSQSDEFDTALDVLFDTVAHVVFAWAEDKDVDPVVSGDFNKPIPEWLTETDGPLQEPLACEADSESIGGWPVEENVLCVSCPDCAFTFDAFHTDESGDYSCPLCELYSQKRFDG